MDAQEKQISSIQHKREHKGEQSLPRQKESDSGVSEDGGKKYKNQRQQNFRSQIRQRESEEEEEDEEGIIIKNKQKGKAEKRSNARQDSDDEIMQDNMPRTQKPSHQSVNQNKRKAKRGEDLDKSEIV